MPEREYVAEYFGREYKIKARSGRRAAKMLIPLLSAECNGENHAVVNRISLNKIKESGKLSSRSTYFMFKDDCMPYYGCAKTTKYDMLGENDLYWICRQSGVTDNEMNEVNSDGLMSEVLTWSQKYLILIDEHMESIELYELLINSPLSGLFAEQNRHIWIRKQDAGFAMGFCDGDGKPDKGMELTKYSGLLDVIRDYRIRHKFLVQEIKRRDKRERKMKKIARKYYDLWK